MLTHSRNTLQRTLALIACSLLTLALGAGTARAAPSRDAWITTKAKIALITTSHISSNTVHVDTVDGRVTLHGKVSTALERENAESVAKGIDGVRGVRNLLQVVAPAAEKMVAMSDDQIKTRVEQTFKDDNRLATSSISVKSVDKGVVLLTGKARNLTGYLAALECASSVTGVRGVASEVKSADTLEEVASTRPTDATSPLLDNWITMATKLKLIADSDVPALEIGVDTRNGNVTLFGIVPTAMAKEAAEADARKIDSVRTVYNDLQIVPDAKREMVDTKDDIVTRDVKTALRTRSDCKQVDVTVKNGVARLTGKSPSGWQRLEVNTLVRSTKGVRSVNDEMRNK